MLNNQKKLIKRIFNYKSENSPIIKKLQYEIVNNDSNEEVYSALIENIRYVLLDNYCLIHKIRIESEENLFQNALESFAYYNNNFGFTNQLICLQYSGIIDDLQEKDKKLLTQYIQFNNSLIDQYINEPFFVYIQAVLNYKLKDYYTAISNTIKFTAFKEDFEIKNPKSGIRHLNSLNRIHVAAAFKIMADCYKELENFKLSEESYLNSIDHSIFIGDWCNNSTSLINFYSDQNKYEELCKFIKYLENNSNTSKCNLKKLIFEIKAACE